VGEKQNRSFQFCFNGFLKVDFQGSRVTSDGGLILVRELDKHLGMNSSNCIRPTHGVGKTRSFRWQTCCGSPCTAGWQAMRT
jgi:hypothetical protein